MSKKEGWRRYVDDTPRVMPEKLTRAAISKLGADALVDYNEDRKDWHANLPVMETPQVKAGLKEITTVVDSNRNDPGRPRSAAVIDSLSQLGKTTLADHYGRIFDRFQRRRFGTETVVGNQRLPVFRLSLREGMTTIGLGRRICRFYGHPGAEIGDGDAVLERVKDCFTSCETQLGIIDDLHFVNPRHKSGVALSNYLKSLSNDIPITFIYTGIGLYERGYFDEGLPAEEVSLSQSGRRWVPVLLRPFDITNDVGRRGWSRLLATIEKQLVLADARPGMLSEMSDYLFARTTGYIGSFMDLIKRGCREAVEQKRECLTMDLLDECPVDSAAMKSERELLAAFGAGRLSTQVRRGRGARNRVEAS
ncbi:TniB family NTP-binding protein [Actinoplanes sp. NPDC020271]|uniref:TniB family NTP-binding protein n=1 Tax=Actinoplanes sp. NPDC020271 TaxID=3363896 RepID=UPI0037A42962